MEKKNLTELLVGGTQFEIIIFVSAATLILIMMLYYTDVILV